MMNEVYCPPSDIFNLMRSRRRSVQIALVAAESVNVFGVKKEDHILILYIYSLYIEHIFAHFEI